MVGRGKELQISIAGAGIGGLAAAALLAKAGHRFTVYDQFDAPRPVGSGLVIQPVGQMVLDAVGAGDAARAMGAPLRRMLGHEARTGRPVLDVRYDWRGTGRHRAAQGWRSTGRPCSTACCGPR